MHISYSRESTYLRCPFAHYLSYVEELTPKKTVRPLQFGGDFHKLLEKRGDETGIKKTLKDIEDMYYELSPDVQSDLGDNYVEDLKNIFDDYNRVYEDSPLPYITEQEFEIKIGTYKGEPVYFIGVIDGLYKDGNNIIVEEHKTFNRRPDMNNLVMNTQKCLYAKAVQKFSGVFPDRVIWDYIKSTPAKEPVWLEKSGKFSQAKSEYITPFSWERACRRRGIDDEGILAQGEKYAGNIPNFFFRYTLDFVENMVEKIWNDFIYVAKEICRNGEKNKTMNVTKDCSWCSFQPICYAMLTGGDVDYVVERDYTHKEKREKKGEVISV